MTSTSPIRAGIIGLSWIAADEARPASLPSMGTATPYSHASAMAAIGGIDVVAGCDLSPDARQAFVERWGDTWPNVATFAEVDEMLATGPELVSVVVPDHLHGVMIDRCLDAGVKTIFTEKPFTTDLAEADRLLTRIAEAGATVAVNHTWRWRPEVAETLALVRSGSLGPLSHVTIEWGGPRAMLFRNLSHFIDLAVYLADSTPVWVSGELEGSEDYGLSYSGDGGSDPDQDPGATVSIGFANGARGYVNGLKSSAADAVINVSMLEGRVLIDTLGGKVIETRRGSDGTPGSVSPPTVRSLAPRHTVAGMQAGLSDLINASRTGRQPSGSAVTARNTVAVIDGILRSQAAGHARVEIAPPPV